MDNWMNCQPLCQKCEQNVFLRVMLMKKSYRIFAGCVSPGSAETNVRWGGKLNGPLMANCVRNIRVKNYQNLIIGFQVTVENVRDAFLGHSVESRTQQQHSVPGFLHFYGQNFPGLFQNFSGPSKCFPGPSRSHEHLNIKTNSSNLLHIHCVR